MATSNNMKYPRYRTKPVDMPCGEEHVLQRWCVLSHNRDPQDNKSDCLAQRSCETTPYCQYECSRWAEKVRTRVVRNGYSTDIRFPHYRTSCNGITSVTALMDTGDIVGTGRHRRILITPLICSRNRGRMISVRNDSSIAYDESMPCYHIMGYS